jgi:hypothetical protein
MKIWLKINGLLNLDAEILPCNMLQVAAQGWADLTFDPKPTKSGYLIEPSQWRETANPLRSGSKQPAGVSARY